MICRICSKDRIDTNIGVCVICKPEVIMGIEKKISSNHSKFGVEVKTKYNKQENGWMS